MAKDLNDLYDEINLILRDTTTGTINNSDRKQALNMACDSLNGEGAFDWQKETVAIAFVEGTFVYTPVLPDFKSPAEMKPPVTSIYREFQFIDVENFNKKMYPQRSGDAMFAIEKIAGTRRLHINHNKTESLDFIHFTNRMVLDGDGVTRKQYFEDTDDTILMPDHHSNVLVFRAAKILQRTLHGDRTMDWKDADDEYKDSFKTLKKNHMVAIHKEGKRLKLRIQKYGTPYSISRR